MKDTVSRLEKEKSMKAQATRFTVIANFLLVAVVALAACAPAPTPAPTPVPPTAVPPTEVPPTAIPPTVAPTAVPAAKPVSLQLAQDPTLGKFLADGDGLSLYMFTQDTKDTSNCYDKCAAAWPPLLTTISPTVQTGVDATLVGTTQRKDGTTQVTYNHWPLYYFASDHKAGDTTGQAVGKVWWVLSGEGFIIRPAALMLASDATLGKFIADGAGLSLYMFTKDTKDTSNCYDKCAAAWPPLLTMAMTATVQTGLDAGLVGATQRKDGSMQVTYNHWPLYYFASDQKAGDTTGQAIGKVWWVLSGEGNLIRPAALTLATDPKLGKFLADGSGQSLYGWAKDTPGTSNCSGKCEQAWPPLLTVGQPTVGDGVTGSLVGTIQRKDGSMQVTYQGLPLYYFASDQKPGDVMGQGIGNVWYVIGADGNMIK
jgi:predicted lipoprotein with Yx(FWY)xxD motif